MKDPVVSAVLLNQRIGGRVGYNLGSHTNDSMVVALIGSPILRSGRLLLGRPKLMTIMKMKAARRMARVPGPNVIVKRRPVGGQLNKGRMCCVQSTLKGSSAISKTEKCLLCDPEYDVYCLFWTAYNQKTLKFLATGRMRLGGKVWHWLSRQEAHLIYSRVQGLLSLLVTLLEV